MDHTISPCDVPKRRTPWNTVSARVISVVSRKGGVGKTTSAVNLGAAFALSGHTVLLVGVDPQCGVSRTLGYAVDELDGGLLDLFEHDVPLSHLAHTTPLKDLFVASPRISTLEEEERFLAAMRDRADDFVRQVDRARNLFDTILIDCPPGLSAATRAALQASDSYLVPVQAEELCRDSLGTLVATVDTLRDQLFGANGVTDAEGLDRPLEIEGFFLTMTNDRTRVGRHVAAKVAEEFGPILFNTAVPRTTRLAEMALRGKPAVIYDRRCAGSRAYFDLADEVVARFCERACVAPPDLAPITPQSDEVIEAPRARLASAEQARPTYRAAQAGGLDRLLEDLEATGALRRPSAPSPDDGGQPELMSLDDLLAEEESDSGSRDWDDSWGTGGRFN
jgi:chromosome partitioning protein